MFYKVVQADNLPKLTRLVEDLLHQGWTLAGGITSDGQSYLQAMTRS
jgi:hypothetical protein